MKYVLVKAIVHSLYIVMKVIKVKNILEALGSKEDGEVARFVNILIYPKPGKHSRTMP